MQNEKGEFICEDCECLITVEEWIEFYGHCEDCWEAYQEDEWDWGFE